jgi:TadE-like protein
MTRRGKTRGQAMVEFAIILPVFILLLVGIFDFGRVVWVNNTLATAAREAARYAVVHGSKSTCPVGPAPVGTFIPVPGPTCLHPSPSRDGIKDVAQNWAAGTSASVTVHVCYGLVTSCTSDTDAANADNTRGTQVMVTVTSLVDLSIPSLAGFSGISLDATSTMLVNH